MRFLMSLSLAALLILVIATDSRAEMSTCEEFEEIRVCSTVKEKEEIAQGIPKCYDDTTGETLACEEPWENSTNFYSEGEQVEKETANTDQEEREGASPVSSIPSASGGAPKQEVTKSKPVNATCIKLKDTVHTRVGHRHSKHKRHTVKRSRKRIKQCEKRGY